MSFFPKIRPVRVLCCLPAMAAFCACFSSAVSAETRGYAISYLTTATYRDENSCENAKADMASLGSRAYKDFFSEPEALEVSIHPNQLNVLPKAVAFRGRKYGKRVSALYYPMSAPDPEYATVTSPYAYGFNLDGKPGSATAPAFEDPETGEQGIDNQLFRAIGCYPEYNVSASQRPVREGNFWRLMLSPSLGSGAWVLTIESDDLSRDGEATVSFYRAITPLRKNVAGQVLADATFVVDESPNNYGVFKGYIRDNQFISSTEGTDFQMTSELGRFDRLALSRARLRLTFNDDGTLAGFIGGYQNWLDFWARQSRQGEINCADQVGLYYNLKKMADADPDPASGENRSISSTYNMAAVPAFVAMKNGDVVATAY